ncbi:hypothetical protein RZS08_53810, partial [Arthrospira platensis SPKY1]|nr:hypothetical protein [Arthrospira platensis SPKY1]
GGLGIPGKGKDKGGDDFVAELKNNGMAGGHALDTLPAVCVTYYCWERDREYSDQGRPATDRGRIFHLDIIC